MPSAVIYFAEKYTTSNADGFFQLECNTPTDTLTVTMLGYKKYRNLIELEGETEVVINLEQEAIEIEQVTVSGERFSEEVIPSDYHLQIGDLRKIPQLGELDALRSLYVFPGVSSTHDFSAQLYIRGGNFDENLISLDGVPIYNPYHLGGITGIVSTELISDEYLYPSNYTPNYGGYLSSVLSMISKDGNRDKLRGSFSLGLVSSGIALNGPLFGGTFSASYRRTYWDIVTSIVYTELPYNYNDIFLKYSIPLSDKSFIKGMVFRTRDQFKVFQEDEYESVNVDEHPTWGNLLSTLEYQHLFSKHSSIKVQLYYSASTITAKAFAINSGSETLFKADNDVNDISALIEYRQKLGANSITAGIKATSLSTSWNWDIGRTELNSYMDEVSYVFFDYADDKYKIKQQTELYNFYALDSVKISRKIDVTFGGRLLYYSNINKLDGFPFLHFTYKPSDNISLVLGYGRYYQEMYTIKELRIESVFSPFSTYFIPKNNNEYSTSNHYLTGLKVKEILPTFDLTLDAYFKQRYNLASSYPDFDNHYSFEEGYAMGLEVMLKHTGWLSGWISYSYSRSVKENEDYKYYSQFDRTHNLKLNFNCKLGDSWQLSAFFIYASGLPFTPISGKYIGMQTTTSYRYLTDSDVKWRTLQGGKNSIRLDDYHRLDIGLNWSFLWGDLIVRPYIQIMNLYHSANPFFYSTSPYTSEPTGVDTRGSFITPTIGVTVDF